MAKSLPSTFLPKNILVRMPNWLGDLIMATPILTDLRNHWPESKISIMCQGVLGSLLKNDPNINEVIEFKKPKNFFSSQKETLAPFQKNQYDLGILLTNSFSSAWWFWRGGVQNKIGYATHGRRLLLDFPIPFPTTRESQHLVITYKMLLASLGIPVSSTPPQVFVTPQEQKVAKEKLALMGIEREDFLIGINPGAAYGSAKCWLPERFKELSRKLLHNQKIKLLYFGDKNGSSLVEEICKDFPTERVLNFAGKTTLRELMAYIQSCSFFLTNDSGPMHLASALNIPLVALFGSTSDMATGPYNGGKVIHKHVSCSPCYRRECPLIEFRCMKQIETEEVYKEIMEIVRV